MKVGDLAPNFELKSQTGETIKLSSYLGKKKVILFFYVKDNTPGCTAEVKGFKDHYQDISGKYELIGINQDSEDSHRKFSERNQIPFKLLSDPGKKVSSLYDAKGALGMYTRRITYLIGLDGKIEEIIEGMAASKHIGFVENLR
jgi:peroxiredoxin Q/BCP